MALWIPWWKMVRQLRPAFARETTFLWFALCLVGLTIRPDLRGVTSIIRALGLKEVFYDRLLDFFHSKAVLVDPLACTGKANPTEITFPEKCGPIIVTCNWASSLKAYCSTSL